MGQFKTVQADIQVYILSRDEKMKLFDAFMAYDDLPLYLHTWGAAEVQLDYDSCPPYTITLAKFDSKQQAEIAFEAYQKTKREMLDGWKAKTSEARIILAKLSEEFRVEWLGAEYE